MANNSKAKLLEEIGDLHRSGQVHADLLDEAASTALGINTTDHRVLDVLQRLGPITAGKLAGEAGLSPGAMTASIDRLTDAGYVQRVPDSDDRRRILVETTPLAEKRAWEIYGPLKDVYTKMMGSYPLEFLRRLRDYLERSNEISVEQRERVNKIRSRK